MLKRSLFKNLKYFNITSEKTSERLLAVSKSALTRHSLSHNSSTMPKLVWVDLEMSGLNIKSKGDRILEAACIITTMDLKEIDSFGPVVIKQSTELLDSMDEWCTNQHGKTGLTGQVKNSTISEEKAGKDLLEFIKKHCPGVREGILAGNSVGEDKRFILEYWPEIVDHLHYRIVDVSSIKSLVNSWYDKQKVDSVLPKKGLSHRAMDDIRESIEELKCYKKEFFK